MSYVFSQLRVTWYVCLGRKRWDNPHQRKRKAKRAAAADGAFRFPYLIKSNDTTTHSSFCFHHSTPTARTIYCAPIYIATNPSAPAPAPRRPAVQMPDEYLPPNKILFLQNLPPDVRQDQLMALFGQYPGLSEVRMIPTKKDIAFVEFVDETTAGVAKDALHNYKLDGEGKIKVRMTVFIDALAARERASLQVLTIRFCLDHICEKVTMFAHTQTTGAWMAAMCPGYTIMNYLVLHGIHVFWRSATNVKQIFCPVLSCVFCNRSIIPQMN